MSAKVKSGSRKAKILAIFNSFPEMVTANAVTAECLKQGLWSKDQHDKLIFSAACKEVKEALNKFTKEGCPESLKHVEILTDEEGKITEVHYHVQKLLWEPEHAVTWIGHRGKQVQDHLEEIKLFIRFCQDRWPEERNWWDLFPELSATDERELA